MCKISVIVPVYNAQSKLRACMDSLVRQTLAEIEIIAVDDGSTDESLEILLAYKTLYPKKVSVFPGKNNGVSHARNFGIEKAKGEFLLFVDSDDFIELTMCQTLYEKAAADGNDLVLCGRFEVSEDMGGPSRTKKVPLRFDLQNFTLSDHRQVLTMISPYPWDKLFKRTLFQDIRFPEGIRFEDLVFVFEIVHKASSIGVIREPLYYYQKTGGFLSRFTPETLDILTAFQILFAYLEENGLLGAYWEEMEYICIRHFFVRYSSCFSLKMRGNLALKRKLIRRTQDFLNDLNPRWRKNRYLHTALPPSLKRKEKLFQSLHLLLACVWAFEKAPLLFSLLKTLRRFFKSRKETPVLTK